ncbi:MAG TPA: endo-1,4-beta-xylanase [Pirellulales bacterium]|nr:endo-1,4-beta-xylanase [Pirellulales bacterium]
MPLALMRMLVDPASGITPQAADRAYLSGLDQIPWPCRARLKDHELQIERAVNESGKLHIPFTIPNRGEMTIATGTLMQRDRPYHLEIELARGKLNQVRNQAAEWQAMGLVLAQPVEAALRRAIEEFSHAVTDQRDAALAAKRARHALATALDVGELLADSYVEQALALRHRQMARLPTFLGLRLDHRLLPAAALAHLLTAFNSVTVPLVWRNVEATEGDYQWNVYDRQIEWFQSHGVHVCAGPLLRLDDAGLPDWLTLWEGDFDGILAFSTDYITRVIERYRGKVALWQCASRVNVGAPLGLQEEQKMQLAVRALETMRKLDPDTPAMICFDQPWGEYLRRSEFALSPLHFADALVRAGLQLGGIGLEINLGYYPAGTWPRDRLDFSRMLDLWSYMGLPLHVMLTVPSGDQPDALARGVSAPLASSVAWTAEVQAAWIKRFVPLMLAKSYVQTITWNQFCDSDVHDFPNGGLFDGGNAAKPAFATLAQLRKKHLH